jgi:integrase
MTETRNSSKSRQGKKPAITLPKHVHRVRAKGKEYFYFQPGRSTANEGGRVRLPGLPTDPEFWAKLKELAGDVPAEPQPRRDTFSALIGEYRASPEFQNKAAATQRDYGRYLAIIEQAWGDKLVKGVRARNIMTLRNRLKDSPASANYLLRVLSLLISFGIPLDYADANPCEHVKKFSRGDGYEPWSWKEILHHRKYAEPRLAWAAAVALYTGQRQGDCLHMKEKHFTDQAVSVRQEKTNKRLWIPLHAQLRPILEEIRAGRRLLRAQERVTSFNDASRLQAGETTLLCNSRGKAWTSSGFRASWNKDMDCRALRPLKKRGRVFHGLRKSAVVFLLEAGCTDAEAAAITGQSREMIEHYSIMVNQRKLATAAILKWEAANTS